MITSLVFGTDKLEMVRIPEVRMVRGKEKTFYKNNIDQTKEFKEFLSNEQNKGLFEIGHSTAESMTFIPHFFKPDDQNLIYSDIAGLMDTAGELIEFVNCFINKKICNLAHKVKFLVAFTSAQMNECRGQPIVD